jgi:hypothetical protein
MSALIDVVSAILWIRVAEQWFSEEVVRAATVLYLFSPLVVLDSSVAGQNQVWISLMLAISMGQLIRVREWLSGIVMGLASIAVKVLAALFAPVLWFGAKRRLGWTIGFLLTLGLALVPLAAIGGNVLFPLQNQGKAISSGNLPFLLSATGLDIARHSTSLNAVGISTLLGMLILAHRRYSNCREAWRLVPWISFMAFLLVFCSKKREPIICVLPSSRSVSQLLWPSAADGAASSMSSSA